MIKLLCAVLLAGCGAAEPPEHISQEGRLERRGCLWQFTDSNSDCVHTVYLIDGIRFYIDGREVREPELPRDGVRAVWTWETRTGGTVSVRVKTR